MNTSRRNLNIRSFFGRFEKRLHAKANAEEWTIGA
jgi:hypothetical protein